MKSRNHEAFRHLARKILIHTVCLLGMATVMIYGIYNFLFEAGFSRMIPSFFQNVFGMEKDAAVSFYERAFRRHMDLIILLSMAGIFFLFLHIYLRYFTRYFEQISKGMDNLMLDIPGEVSLPAELLPIERKMNLLGHIIDRQKSDMALMKQRKNDMIMYLAHDLKTPLTSVIGYLSLLNEEQRKNDLVVYLAHDLKTPLASSISYLNLLLEEKAISEELREKYLSISLAKNQRLEDLLNEFLEIAKYDLSHIVLQCSRIDLSRLLEQLVFEFQPILEQKKLTCRLDMGEHLVLECDVDRMQRVFDNLLRNAVLYSQEGSQITVTAEYKEGGLELQFANHGDTIPQEKLDRIFEQFYRLDAGRSTDGSGLGLAIAKQIVTLHGGTITAASRQGMTIFTIKIPQPAM